MAYKRRIMLHCTYPHCRGAARYEVFNSRNADLGRYCTRHAEKVLDEQLNRERRLADENDGA